VTRILLDNLRLLDPEARQERAGALLLEGGRIAAHLAPGASLAGAERRDLGGLAVAPGFLDLHYHGRLIFDDPRQARASLRHAACRLLRHGVTAFLPTTVAWPHGDLCQRVRAWVEAAETLAEEAGACVLGLHLEGPWIRPEAAGAQPRDGIRPYREQEGAELLAACAGRLRMVTLAPELPGSPALLRELGRRGIVASLGHSLAEAEQAESAVEQGARHVTHLFNAMGAFHHRDRGLAGVALTDDRLSCDLICDGVHVHPRVVAMAARVKRSQLLLISDHVELPEGPPGRVAFGAGPVHDDGRALRLEDGTLAGSSLLLDRALHNAQAFGAMSRLEAVAACSLRPARLLGIEAERGTLRPGARADLVVLDDSGAVREVWKAGRRAHGPSWEHVPL